MAGCQRIQRRLFVICAMALVLGACDRGGGKSDTSVSLGERIRSASDAVSLKLPPGWSYQDTSYSINHYTDVFGIVRNPAAGSVAPHDSVWPSGNGARTVACAPWVIRAQLPDHSVIILFTHLAGPPGDWMWEFREDTVGERLVEGLDTLTTGWQSQEGLAAQHIRFCKWSESWYIAAYAPAPLGSMDRNAVRAVLESIEFPLLPVVQAEQALRYAWKVLPEELRNADLPGCPRAAQASRDPCSSEGGTIQRTYHALFDVELGSEENRRRTLVVQQDTSFAVTFEVGNRTDGISWRSWSAVVGHM